MMTPPVLVAAAVGLVLGALLGFLVSSKREQARQELEKSRAQDEASRILERARSEADNVARRVRLITWPCTAAARVKVHPIPPP